MLSVEITINDPNITIKLTTPYQPGILTLWKVAWFWFFGTIHGITIGSSNVHALCKEFALKNDYSTSTRAVDWFLGSGRRKANRQTFPRLFMRWRGATPPLSLSFSQTSKQLPRERWLMVEPREWLGKISREKQHLHDRKKKGKKERKGR